ncbi:MAG: AraC family transcriptional regulator [Comamonadaceae bacterium]|nr:AraC family transcriptional regulator [Comamonadaceae bacterium]
MNPDIVSDVLRRVRLRGSLYFHVRGSRDWAAEAPPSRDIAAAVMPAAEHVMEFHMVLSGACWAGALGAEPVHLAAGDLVIFAQGDPHVVSSRPGLRAQPHVQGYFERQHQARPFRLHLDACEIHAGDAPGDAGDTTLVCGFLGCDLRPFNPLIAALPHALHLPAATGQGWAAECMRQAVQESNASRPGSGAMIERLSEMLFIDAMRRYLGTLPDGSPGWLGALRDRFVGRALALLHESPEAPWTVDELGRRVGLSRSSLHERFAVMVGDTPMQYLARWRIQVGAALLRDSACTVADVALQTGYESEAAFGRAFKRLVGQTPAAWRRSARG